MSDDKIDLQLLGARVASLIDDVRDLKLRFSALEARLGGLEARLGGIEGRLGGLETRFAGQEERMSAMLAILVRLAARAPQ